AFPRRRDGRRTRVSYHEADVSARAKPRAATTVNSHQPRDTKPVCADRIVCAGRLAEGGKQRTPAPSSHTGVLEVARGESLMTPGWETSGDVRWPRTTALYKGNRSQRWSSEESAGLIVPFEGWDSTTQPEGRSPTSVTGVQCR